jgi:hypothetical protein
MQSDSEKPEWKKFFAGIISKADGYLHYYFPIVKERPT